MASTNFIADNLDEHGPLTVEDDSESKDTSNAKDNDGEIPEKFRGKQLEDVIQMYSELEKVTGRQGRELGELRRVTDDYIRGGTRQPPDEVLSDNASTETVDIYEDPGKFVESHIQKAVKPLQEKLQNSEKQEMLRRLGEAHPDFMEVSNDPAFLKWVSADPFRQKQFRLADNYDLDASLNLFGTYKELQAKKSEDQEREKQEQLNAAGMVDGRSGQSAKKIYNRAALVRLQNEDPAKYEQLQPEIMRAYREGRVR